MCKNMLYLFLTAWCLIACGGRSSDKEEIHESPGKSPVSGMIAGNNNIAAIQIYIENSGSMNGYVNGNTSFKEAVQDLLIMLKYYYKTDYIHLYFINSEIHAIGDQASLAHFTSTLNPKTFKVGSTASSNLNGVFKQILDKTHQDTLAILLSDCIYSIKGNKTEELLSNEKNLTKDAFLTKFKRDGNDLTTIIVKLTSTFKGAYYDKNEKPTWLGTGNDKRPYYLTVIGDNHSVTDFSSKINLSKDKIAGFESKYTLSTQDFSKQLLYAVVQSKSSAGDWNYAKHASTGKAIERVRVNDRQLKPFTFSIAVDLRKIPVEEKYLMNPENYRIAEGNYQLVAIKRYNKQELKPQGEIFLQKANITPTHLLIFQANSKKYTDLSFSLKKQIPKWVEETHTEDDTDIQRMPGKTFGLRYLVEGISEAYETVSKSADNYFQINLNIKK